MGGGGQIGRADGVQFDGLDLGTESGRVGGSDEQARELLGAAGFGAESDEQGERGTVSQWSLRSESACPWLG